MDALKDRLLDPPFAKDPPVKLAIPAKTLGLVYAILGGISAVFGLAAVVGLLGLMSGVAVALGVGGVVFLIVIGTLVSEIGTIAAAWGGYKMYQGDRDGKRLVIYGLVVNVVGGLVSALGTYGGGLVGWIISACIAFVLYYLVIISRFEGEPALATAGAGSGGPPR